MSNPIFTLGQLTEGFHLQYASLLNANAQTLFSAILYFAFNQHFNNLVVCPSRHLRAVTQLTNKQYHTAFDLLYSFMDSCTSLPDKWLIKKTTQDDLIEINYQLLLQVWERRRAYFNQEQKDRKLPKLKISYQQYLESDHWKQVRAQTLKRAWYKCQICNSKDDLQVHHNNYDCLGDEKPSDLIVVCGQCHNEIYARLKERRAE